MKTLLAEPKGPPKVSMELLREDLEQQGWTSNAVDYILSAVIMHDPLLRAARIALERLGKLPGSAEIGIEDKACDLLQKAIARCEAI